MIGFPFGCLGRPEPISHAQRFRGVPRDGPRSPQKLPIMEGDPAVKASFPGVLPLCEVSGGVPGLIGRGDAWPVADASAEPDAMPRDNPLPGTPLFARGWRSLGFRGVSQWRRVGRVGWGWVRLPRVSVSGSLGRYFAAQHPGKPILGRVHGVPRMWGTKESGVTFSSVHLGNRK